MTLQKKTLSLVMMTFAALIIVIYIASGVLLSQGVSNVESGITKNDLERAQNSLQTNLRTLEGTARDWSLWADSYQFIQDRNQEFIDANLATPAVMDSIQLNLMLYVDEQANIVFARAYDYRSGEEMPLWPELAKQIYLGSPLLQHADVDSSMTGIFQLSGASILLASEPILHDANPGSIKGTLIFGRLLDKGALEQLGQDLLTHVELYGLTNEASNSQPLPPEVDKALAALSTGTEYFTLDQSETSVAGFTMLNDIYGKPTYVLRTDVARDAYARANAVIGLFVLVLIGLGLIFALVIGVAFHFMVLSRLGRLKSQVADISANQDVATRVETTGSDELTDLARSINEMLSSLQRAQAEQLKAEKRFRSTFHANPAVEVLTRVADGRILDVNEAFVDLFGYSSAEVVGRNGTELNIWGDLEHMRKLTIELQEHGSVRGREVVFRMKSGELKSILYSVQHIEIGGEACLLSAGLDISRLKEAEELKTAKEIAEQTNQAKTEFLSRMSHELRTPLNAVLGFAQLLQVEEPRQDQEEGLDFIIKGGRHLLNLINEVLDIASIDGGHMLINVEPVELTQVLQECVAIVQPLASQLSVTVSMDRAAELEDRTVLADPQRLKQVVLNLLANAVKYNRPGGRVLVSCAQTTLASGMIRIGVQDNGLGIAADKMSYLFQPFERLGAERSDVEGTGLGLALSKRLVEAMHGKIGAESVPGRGSTFWIELPVTAMELSGSALRKSLRTGPFAMKKIIGHLQTVLYIEDNLSNLRLVENILRKTDLKVLAAMQGRLGLDLAQQNQPDLILLDLNLPDMGGDEVLRLLREDPATAHIPVLILSADAIPLRIEQLTALGAQGYLTKPLNVAQFLTAVAKYLSPNPVHAGEPVLEIRPSMSRT